MVSATDFSDKSGILGAEGVARPKRRWFWVFAAFAAPFRDVDDRAVKQHRKGAIRNNSKGNMFAAGVATPARVPVKRFPRGDD